MHSLKYAFRFIWASFSLAFKKVQLQEQWLYLAIGNFVLLLIWFLPFGLTVGLIGFRPVGFIFIGLISIFMLFSFYVWGEITREEISKALANIFQENTTPEEKEQERSTLFDHWPEILLWTMLRPVNRVRSTLRQGLKPNQEEKHPWIDSDALMIPLISQESLGIKEAASRIQEILDGHLLRFKPGFIKVDLLAKLFHWILGMIGILAGLSLMIILTDSFSTNPWQRVLAVGIGLMVGWVFLTMGYLFSAYVRTCYHTALYQWVMNVKAARESADPTKAKPPGILLKALGQSEIILNKKES